MKQNQEIQGVVTEYPHITPFDLYAFSFLTDEGKWIEISIPPSTSQETVNLLYPNAQLIVQVELSPLVGLILVDLWRDDPTVTKADTLLEYNGYTIDFRLKEFRKFEPNALPEFIRFDEPEGKRLMAAFKQSLRKA